MHTDERTQVHSIREGNRTTRHGRSSLRVLSPSRRKDHSRDGRGGLCSPERFRWQSPCWVVQRRVLLAWAPRVSAIRQRYTRQRFRKFEIRKFETEIEMSSEFASICDAARESQIHWCWRSPKFSSVDRWTIHRICLSINATLSIFRH